MREGAWCACAFVATTGARLRQLSIGRLKAVRPSLPRLGPSLRGAREDFPTSKIRIVLVYSRNILKLCVLLGGPRSGFFVLRS